jgi:predicted AlkP superfamily pyrophosphatase or phosphodiesterase
MPNLTRLKNEGTFYSHSHSVFPTVTRVNAAAISTGTLPYKNGIVANSMFVKEVNPSGPFTTSNYLNLLKLGQVNGGRLLPTQTLGEVVERAGLKFVALSSGSTGNALLLNPTAPDGTGVLINGGFDPNKKVAFPAAINSHIIKNFGAVKSDNGLPSLEWTERVMREYVLSELRPNVLVDWMTEPDATQHKYGVGSPEALSMLKKVDEQIGHLLLRLKDLNLDRETNIIVVSDHGFARNEYGINVTDSLIKNKLKTNSDSDDLIVVTDGPTVLLHVRNKDARKIRHIVRYLQSQSWVGVIFTADEAPRPDVLQRANERRALKTKGWVSGTFSLESIHQASVGNRAPDILFTLPWTSEKNRFGVAGSDTTTTTSTPGPIAGDGSGHGSMNPYVVNNTMLMWGPGFRRATVVDVPSSNVDVMPTILALLSLDRSPALDGRALTESLRDGPDPKQVPFETTMVTTDTGARYGAVLQFSTVGRTRYIDKSWRTR